MQAYEILERTAVSLTHTLAFKVVCVPEITGASQLKDLGILFPKINQVLGAACKWLNNLAAIPVVFAIGAQPVRAEICSEATFSGCSVQILGSVSQQPKM